MDVRMRLNYARTRKLHRRVQPAPCGALKLMMQVGNVYFLNEHLAYVVLSQICGNA
jgi:hypothetical protein